MRLSAQCRQLQYCKPELDFLMIGRRSANDTAMDPNALRASLLEAFREFDTVSAISLIAEIAYKWGWLAAERDHHNNGRIIAEKIVVSILDREPRPNRPLFSSGRTAGLEEIEQPGLEWAEQLVKLPEDEALRAFGEAFWEWLLTADLSIYRHEEDTDFTVVGMTFQHWRDFASV